MKRLGSLIVRLARDERGMESMEVALGIALVAAIAGFGMIVLGDALANFFSRAGSSLDAVTFPP
jgi:Flp pilus assembly pilin Flp